MAGHLSLIRASSLHSIQLLCLLGIVGFPDCSAWSQVGRAQPHGYVSDITKEKAERYKEIFLFVRPNAPKQPLLESIFNLQLSKEFRDKYREKFGQLDTESIVYQSGARSSADPLSNDLNRDSEEAIARQKDRRAFGEFMVKRLAEWHTDNYFKSEPNMRPVYELKEKLSKVDVRVTKTTKLEVRYELSSNNLDFIVDNPYLESKVSLEMDPGSIGPSRVQENRIWLGKNLTQKTRVKNTWATIDGLTTLEFIFLHHSRLSTSVGSTAKYSSRGRAEGATRYLVGMNYLF